MSTCSTISNLPSTDPSSVRGSGGKAYQDELNVLKISSLLNFDTSESEGDDETCSTSSSDGIFSIVDKTSSRSSISSIEDNLLASEIADATLAFRANEDMFLSNKACIKTEKLMYLDSSPNELNSSRTELSSSRTELNSYSYNSFKNDPSSVAEVSSPSNIKTRQPKGVFAKIPRPMKKRGLFRARAVKQKIYRISSIVNPVPLSLAKSRNYLPIEALRDRFGKNGKVQGRPYTNYLQARFYLHEDVQGLYCYLTKRNSFDYDAVKGETAHKQESSAHMRKNTLNYTNLSNDSPTYKSIIFDYLEINLSIYQKLAELFRVQGFRFVKVIRDVSGKLIKLESVEPSATETMNAAWIKRNICFPRYKSRMKIHLVKCGDRTLPFRLPRKCIIYNDPKMFDWDYQNQVVKLNDQNNIIIIRKI